MQADIKDLNKSIQDLTKIIRTSGGFNPNKGAGAAYASSPSGGGSGGSMSGVGSTLSSLASSPFNITSQGTSVIGKFSSAITGLVTSLGAGGPFKILGAVFTKAAEGVAEIVDKLATLDAEARRNIVGIGGYYGEIADGMMKQMLPIMSDVAALGVTSSDVLEGVKSLMESSGRVALYSKQTIDAGLTASAAYTDTNTKLLENAEEFRKVGFGLTDAAKQVTLIGERSVSLGLNAKQVSDVVIKNVEKLNQFGFRNGIEGLSKMVQEAQGLKISIENTLSIADKLFDPDKAIDMAANLQVIGGAIGDFGDPLKMMYDATNNVEGLQTSLIGAAKSLATYNEQQGRFEVSGANLRRAKAMADALGMSMGDLTNMAVKGAAKFEALSEIEMFSNITPEQKEFVSNMATMQGGKVGLDLPEDVAKKIFGPSAEGGFKSMQEMSGHLEEFQEIQKKIAAQKPEDIARAQYNAVTNIENLLRGIAYKAGGEIMKSGTVEKMEKTISDISSSMYKNLNPKDYKTTLDVLEKAKNEGANAIKSAIDGILVKSFGREQATKIESFAATVKDGTMKLYEGIKNTAEKIVNSDKAKAATPSTTPVEEKKSITMNINVPNVGDAFGRYFTQNQALVNEMLKTNSEEYT